jgi:hypothetical protein
VLDQPAPNLLDNRSMATTRTFALPQTVCTCGKPLNPDEIVSVCTCGRRWENARYIRGTPEEVQRLADSGFVELEAHDGRVYYKWLDGGFIVYLYGNGTWFCDEAVQDGFEFNPDSSLEDFLRWFEERRNKLVH